MKYIKYYEQNRKLYEIGEYVLVDLTEHMFILYSIFEENKQPGKIVGRENSGRLLIEFNNNCTFSIYSGNIIRNLTPDEINNFKMLKNKDKFNL